MKTQSRISTLAAAILVLGLTGGAGRAADTTCLQSLKGTSGMQRSLTPATDSATPRLIKRSYAKAFAAGRAEAIAEWQGKVNKACPGRTSVWLRAKSRTVEACDQAMGGRFAVCVSAVPGRSWRGR
jgi:hypothetical protein